MKSRTSKHGAQRDRLDRAGRSETRKPLLHRSPLVWEDCSERRTSGNLVTTRKIKAEREGHDKNMEDSTSHDLAFPTAENRRTGPTKRLRGDHGRVDDTDSGEGGKTDAGDHRRKLQPRDSDSAGTGQVIERGVTTRWLACSEQDWRTQQHKPLGCASRPFFFLVPKMHRSVTTKILLPDMFLPM